MEAYIGPALALGQLDKIDWNTPDLTIQESELIKEKLGDIVANQPRSIDSQFSSERLLNDEQVRTKDDIVQVESPTSEEQRIAYIKKVILSTATIITQITSDTSATKMRKSENPTVVKIIEDLTLIGDMIDYTSHSQVGIVPPLSSKISPE